MLCFIKKIDVLLKIDALPSLTRLRKEWDRVVGKTERLAMTGQCRSQLTAFLFLISRRPSFCHSFHSIAILKEVPRVPYQAGK
jgi:hypothetical protein